MYHFDRLKVKLFTFLAYIILGDIMNYLKKIGTSIIVSISVFIMLLLITTLLSYLNIIKSTGITITNLLIPIISLFSGACYLGSRSTKLGWLEGLKLGLIFILMFLIINITIYKGFVIKSLIYYSILLVTSIFGSMIGIVNKKNRLDN